MSLRVILNGKEEVLESGKTLQKLMEQKNLPKIGLAVAINGQVVPKNQWAATKIHPDDEIEIIHAVQGG